MRNLFIIIISFFIFDLYGQTLGTQLNNRLKGKQDLYSIMFTVDSFYRTLPQNIRDNGGDGLAKEKHWRRWEWYMARRLGPRGEFVNISQMNLDAARISKSNKRYDLPQLPGKWKSIGTDSLLYSNNVTNSYGNGIGRVDRIAFHPTDPNIYFLGTPNGGLWKTTDGGNTYKALTDTLASIGISGVVVSYNNPNTLYILTGTGDKGLNSIEAINGLIAPCLGVMKSTDGGVTWAFVGSFPTTPGLPTLLAYDLVQDPTNANILFAATNDGVFRTTNGGTSWTKVINGLTYDIEFKPGSGSTIYAADTTRVFYTNNGGNSWTQSTFNINPMVGNARIALTTTPAKNSNVYALAGSSPGAGTFAGVYKSTNNGVSFTRTCNTPNVMSGSSAGSDSGNQAGYDIDIAVSPIDTNIVLTCGINVWRSQNGGNTFSLRSYWVEWDTVAPYVHADHHNLSFNPINNKLYSCNDGGVWETSNNATTWKSRTKGLVLNQFYHLTTFPGAPYVMAGGLQDNGIKYRPAGLPSFTHAYGADGFGTSFVAGNKNEYYVSLNTSANRMKFSDGSIVGISTPAMGGAFFKELLAHPTDSNTVFCGANAIWRSTNKGSSWTNTGGIGSHALAISKVNTNIMYGAGNGDTFAGTNTNAYRSSNGGTSWTQINIAGSGLPLTLNNIVTDIEADPIDANIAYMTLGGFTAGAKVYQTNNAGTTWTNITFNLPNVVVNSITASYSKIYVGTDISVYSMDFGGSTWTDIGDNFPHAPVTDLAIDEATGTITAATFGRGVWQRQYCVNDINLTYDLKGRLDYKSNITINTSSLVPGMNNVDSIFMTSGKVLLQPGFLAKTGTHMKAQIGNCDNGPQPLTRKKPEKEALVEVKRDDER